MNTDKQWATSLFFVSRNTQLNKAAIGCLFHLIINTMVVSLATFCRPFCRLYRLLLALLIGVFWRHLTTSVTQFIMTFAPLIGVSLTTFIWRHLTASIWRHLTSSSTQFYRLYNAVAWSFDLTFVSYTSTARYNLNTASAVRYGGRLSLRHVGRLYTYT